MSRTSNKTSGGYKNGHVSNIPLLRTHSKNSLPSPINKTSSTDETLKWKSKFEESEKKRKGLLAQHEKSLRVYNDLEKKYTNLQVKQEELETELFEKNESLTKLTTVSKNLFQEYEVLKNKYETETEAMNRALNDASQWYKENKVLRRRTLLIDHDAVDEGVDTDESITDNDLENLRESVKQLSQEVAELQTELNSSKLLEFETSEANATLLNELETERKKCFMLELELKELYSNNEQMIRVSNIMKRELEELREQEQKEKLNVESLRKQLHEYKKERNVLAHQSTLLMQGIDSTSNMDSIMLLNEIEDLKRLLEDERNKYNSEISLLQEKLDEQENNSYTEVLEERLKLAESELEHALKRAEVAEKAPPVPPPPPPLPVLISDTPTVPLRLKKISKSSMECIQNEKNNENIPQKVECKKVMPGVNEDIINQIKGGTFTLRKRKNDGKKKERETSKAVSEMLNVLGSLRRVARNKNRESLSNISDVQL